MKRLRHRLSGARVRPVERRSSACRRSNIEPWRFTLRVMHDGRPVTIDVAADGEGLACRPLLPPHLFLAADDPGRSRVLPTASHRRRLEARDEITQAKTRAPRPRSCALRTIAFLGINGRQVTLSNDDAYDLVIAVTTGQLDDVSRSAPLSAGDRDAFGEGPHPTAFRVCPLAPPRCQRDPESSASWQAQPATARHETRPHRVLGRRRKTWTAGLTVMLGEGEVAAFVRDHELGEVVVADDLPSSCSLRRRYRRSTSDGASGSARS
jgi:hypothetical protein